MVEVTRREGLEGTLFSLKESFPTLFLESLVFGRKGTEECLSEALCNAFQQKTPGLAKVNQKL